MNGALDVTTSRLPTKVMKSSIVEAEPSQKSFPAKASPAEPARIGSSRNRSVVNVALNLAGVATDAVTAFVVTPVLIRGMGDEAYGIWLLINSFFYLGMFDLGMRGAVGRFIAIHRAQGDMAGVHRVLSTACTFLSIGGTVACVACFIAAAFLDQIFTIAPEQAWQARGSLMLVGIQLGTWFVLRAFDATLWAYQRFDILNLVDIATTVARALLMGWCVLSGGGLLLLSAISLLSILVNGLAKMVAAYKVSGGLVITPALASKSTLRELAGYGFWNFVTSGLVLVRNQVSPPLVGALLGVRFITPFSVVMRLPSLAGTIIAAAVGTFTPKAVEFHARGESERQRQLVLQGAKLSACLAFYFLILFFWLGKPLLSIWIAPRFADHWPLLAIVALGEFWPMVMSLPQGVLLAMAKHRPLAWFAVWEAVLSLALAATAAHFWGLLGVVAAVAISAAVFRGFCVTWLACKAVHIPLRGFLWCALSTPTAVALLAATAAYGFQCVSVPTSWGSLIGNGLGFTAIYALLILAFVIGFKQARDELNRVLRLRPISSSGEKQLAEYGAER